MVFFAQGRDARGHNILPAGPIIIINPTLLRSRYTWVERDSILMWAIHLIQSKMQAPNKRRIWDILRDSQEPSPIYSTFMTLRLWLKSIWNGKSSLLFFKRWPLWGKGSLNTLETQRGLDHEHEVPLPNTSISHEFPKERAIQWLLDLQLLKRFGMLCGWEIILL